MSDNLPDIPDDDDNGGLVNSQALEELEERVERALSPLGLTLVHEGVAWQYHDGILFAVLPCVVRPSAASKVAEDREARAQLNRMLAEQHEEQMRKEQQRMARLASNLDDLAKILFEGDEVEETCPVTGASHRFHPTERFCLDCNAGLD